MRSAEFAGDVKFVLACLLSWMVRSGTGSDGKRVERGDYGLMRLGLQVGNTLTVLACCPGWFVVASH